MPVLVFINLSEGLPMVTLVVKNLPAKAGDVRNAHLIPGLGRSPGGGHGNPLQYSCLENHGRRSLACDSPWGLRELNTIEKLSTSFSP